MSGRLSKSRLDAELARRSGVLPAPSGLDIDFSAYRCGPGLHQDFAIHR